MSNVNFEIISILVWRHHRDGMGMYCCYCITGIIGQSECKVTSASSLF